MAFRVLHGLAPPYLNQLVRVVDLPGRHRFRSSSTHLLHVRPFRLSTVGRRSFPVSTSILWNSLKLNVQSSHSLPVFCQRLKMFLFRRHFLRYCYDSFVSLLFCAFTQSFIHQILVAHNNIIRRII